MPEMDGSGYAAQFHHLQDLYQAKFFERTLQEPGVSCHASPMQLYEYNVSLVFSDLAL